ncbi:UxaA family hydrolase [Desulfovibrio subterraneus]|uniref:UxaA family hydrolase n=1 Tax=Desulfovibrio subterraneus TaxID=2718620 RepID=UPI0022B88281|nr:UxaA family hydrolase [Desulfovibrio subterraneus]WBF66010.1 UxaA family hydrolase [Desulfovibrio subterraneus]
MNIYGYKRANGTYGVRNHLLVIPTSVCAADTAAKIAAQIPGAVSIPNQHGCCQIGSDLALTQKTITGFGLNPNVGAVLVVGLGCDGVQARAVAEEVAASGKPVEYVVIQECGGTLKAIAKGAELAAPMARALSTQERVAFDISEIVMAMECGGSDPTSGLASNPSIGYVADKLVKLGGSAILSETTEVIGAEHLIAARFEDDDQRAKFLAQVKSVEDRAIMMGEDLRSGQPTPGNKVGGLSTIEEKSLGCMYKAGTCPFKGALDYAELLPREKPGMYFMDTPGQDIDSITGMVAGGAQVVIFSTGRGTPTGCPIAPVIKITGNPDTFAKMPDNLDVNAGRIISEGVSLPEVGEEVFDLLTKVCNGQQTKAESLGHREFGIYKLTGTF